MGREKQSKGQVITKFLPVKLTEQEKQDFARELAAQQLELRQKEDQKKTITSQFGSEISAIEGKIDKLANMVSSGKKV